MARAGPGGRRGRDERGRLGVHRRAGRRQPGTVGEPQPRRSRRRRPGRRRDQPGPGGRGGGRAPRAARLHEPVPRRRRARGRRTPGPARRRRSTRSSRPPPISPSRSWWPTASRCSWTTRPPASSAAAHAGRPGMTSGIVGRTVAAMRDLGATSISAAVGPVGLRPLLRGARRDARGRRRGEPGVRGGVVDGDAGDRRRGRAWSTSCTPLDVAVRWVPGCTREQPDLYSYRRDGRHRPLRRASYACCPAGPTGERTPGRRAGRSWPAGSRRSRRASRAACARRRTRPAPRSPSSS